MDLTVVATPGYFASMRAEYLWLRKRAEQRGPSPADYERRDTIASLSMGVISLVAPVVVPQLLRPITPGKGKFGKALLGVAAGALVATTVADAIVRRAERNRLPRPEHVTLTDRSDTAASPARPEPLPEQSPAERIARRVAQVGGVTAVAAGGVAITTTIASRVSVDKMWKRGAKRDLGGGLIPLAAAIVAWDFIYYWNHRFMHESRYMWAIHVVHHSSEHYNLSTALRQPVADAFGTFVPYSLLALFGIRPEHIATARGVHLLYQYWIHTDAIRTLGPGESVLNTPAHHRVHHGSNRQYLDRNHGSILIVWDRLFGTFEPEREPVVYGLTKNIETFEPGRIATHEHADILRDVARSTSWRERLSYVVRRPGWAYDRHRERAGGEASPRPAWPAPAAAT